MGDDNDKETRASTPSKGSENPAGAPQAPKPTTDVGETISRLEDDGNNPENFGTHVPAELKVLSDEEKDLVSGGSTIAGAQEAVKEAGGEATPVNKSLLDAGEAKSE